MSSPTNHPLEQQRLGDFVLDREIGRGGMGVVFSALQISLNRQVALKVLSNTIGLTTKSVQRFHREAEAAARLHHTNIVPIYATGEDNGAHFYAMELIDGPSLDQVIHKLKQVPTNPQGAPRNTTNEQTNPTPLDATGPYLGGQGAASPSSGLSASSLNSGSAYFDTVARMIAEVADALDYAHQQGVIHRDIKPSNLLLAPTGRLSVNDFGLARMLEQPGMTITGEMVGTPRYMSPEQITAGRIPVDQRTDIYSLGATLYEMLTLRPPFDAESRDQLLAQVIQKEPKPPRKVNAKIPVDLETICLKGMEKDPDRRYQTAGQMAEDLRRYGNRFAILARRAGPISKTLKWVKRNRALSAALAAVLVVGGVAAGMAYRAHFEAVKHDLELLEEKRRSALDKAMLASRLEDFDGAREAIRAAEKLGCSAGQIRMLQGQLELYQGHTKESIEQLTQAVELLPDSVAAWSLLAVAFNHSGQQTDSARAITEAMKRTPVTQEDFLFRGHAESTLDPENGLLNLDEAVRKRPSALAHLLRTEALKLQVLIRPDLGKAKLAMEDIQAIKRQFPENAMVLSLHALVHLTCYFVFDDLHEPTLRQAAFTEGKKDVRALERYSASVQAMVARWTFLEETGQAGVGLADLRRSCNETKSPVLVFNLGSYCYKQGDFEQAVKAYELSNGENTLDLLRILALAELLPGGIDRANKLYLEVADRDLSEWDLFNSQVVLRALAGRMRPSH